MKLKNLNYDKKKYKTQIVEKLKNSKCNKTPKPQIVTKLKFCQNSKCDQTQIVTKFKNSIWGKTFLNCDKSQFMRRKTNLS